MAMTDNDVTIWPHVAMPSLSFITIGQYIQEQRRIHTELSRTKIVSLFMVLSASCSIWNIVDNQINEIRNIVCLVFIVI